MHRTLLLTAFVAGALVIAGCGSSHHDTSSAHGKAPFTVTSTLDGKKVLPHRIRWVVKVHGAQVTSVEFLIDGGAPRWIEKDAPYVFGEDEGGQHMNYLVTSWLTPGQHSFIVRATTADGRKATDTVTAQIDPAPEPPGDLGGTWKRTISDASNAPKDGTPGNPTGNVFPAGTYRLVIDRRMIQTQWPGTYQAPQSEDSGSGWIIDSDYVARTTSLRALGPVTFQPNQDPPVAEAGWWCLPDGPQGTYRWSVTDDTLTLTPGPSDPCTSRSFVWAGKWTRVD